MIPSYGDLYSLLGAVVLGTAFVGVGGCDAVQGVEHEEQRSPSVFALRLEPDSISRTDRSSDAEQDTISLSVAASASDPDGDIDRVLFTVEPASNPRGTAFGQLRPVEGAQHEYVRNFALLVPAVPDEIYTVRVFAVDNDSLASNQVTGQVRVAPSGSTETSASSSVPGSSEPPVDAFQL